MSKILILSEAFPPETKSASTLFYELATSFVKRGHEVSFVTRMPQYNLASGTDCTKIPAKEIVAGINVYRFKIPPFARNIPLIRGLEHFILSIILFCGALFNIKDYD